MPDSVRIHVQVLFWIFYTAIQFSPLCNWKSGIFPLHIPHCVIDSLYWLRIRTGWLLATWPVKFVLHVCVGLCYVIQKVPCRLSVRLIIFFSLRWQGSVFDEKHTHTTQNKVRVNKIWWGVLRVHSCVFKKFCIWWPPDVSLYFLELCGYYVHMLYSSSHDHNYSIRNVFFVCANML